MSGRSRIVPSTSLERIPTVISQHHTHNFFSIADHKFQQHKFTLGRSINNSTPSTTSD